MLEAASTPLHGSWGLQQASISRLAGALGSHAAPGLNCLGLDWAWMWGCCTQGETPLSHERGMPEPVLPRMTLPARQSGAGLLLVSPCWVWGGCCHLTYTQAGTRGLCWMHQSHGRSCAWAAR